MKKYLLIPIFFIAALATANAGCGGCKEKKSEKECCPKEKCCSKGESCCAEKEDNTQEEEDHTHE